MQMMLKAWWRLVAFGFRLLYNEMAFTYDAISYVVSLGEWRSWQGAPLQFLPPPQEGKILDLAHGTGNLQLDLQGAGYDTIGYDLSPYMGRITTHKLKRKNRMPKLVNGMAQQLPFADQSFSAVVSTFPTNFIFAPETVNDVLRVLCDGGAFIIVPNGVLTGRGAVKSFIDWLYKITGQTSETHQPLQNPFDALKIPVENHTVSCHRSFAQVIIMRKPKNP